MELAGQPVEILRGVGRRQHHDPVPLGALRHGLDRGENPAERGALALRAGDALEPLGFERDVDAPAVGVEPRDRRVEAVEREPVEQIVLDRIVRAADRREMRAGARVLGHHRELIAERGDQRVRLRTHARGRFFPRHGRRDHPDERQDGESEPRSARDVAGACEG
jgi:hypothetical protein